MLALPESNRQYTSNLDVCDRQKCCVLPAEKENNSTEPIIFSSKTLTDEKKSVDTLRHVCLVDIWVVWWLRSYLQESQFILSFHLQTLPWFLNLADATKRLPKWRLPTMKYNFKTVHRACMKQQAADALSALPTAEIDDIELEDETQVMVVTWTRNKDRRNLLCQIGPRTRNNYQNIQISMTYYYSCCLKRSLISLRACSVNRLSNWLH